MQALPTLCWSLLSHAHRGHVGALVPLLKIDACHRSIGAVALGLTRLCAHRLLHRDLICKLRTGTLNPGHFKRVRSSRVLSAGDPTSSALLPLSSRAAAKTQPPVPSRASTLVSPQLGFAPPPTNTKKAGFCMGAKTGSLRPPSRAQAGIPDRM